MPKKKKTSWSAILKIILVVICILGAYYIGQYLWQEKNTIQEAKDHILEQPTDETDETGEVVRDTSEDIIPKTQTIIPESIDPEEASFDTSDFPVSTDFGNPVYLGEGSITYSDLKGLEITQLPLSSDLTCDNLDIYLDSVTQWYYWWNSCRDIGDKKWLSVFFIALDDDKYTYEKRYFLFESGIYGRYELTSEAVEDIEDRVSFLKEKNAELKETNPEYAILDVVDNLFIEILQK